MLEPSSCLPEPATSDSEAVGPSEPPAAEQELFEEDLLVEDISIDGMCGVY